MHSPLSSTEIKDLIIDVGANHGEFALAMATRNPEIKVLAIDPLPHLCAEIRNKATTAGLVNMWIEPIAIDLTQRTAKFNVANHHDQGISSLLPLDQSKISIDEYWKDRADLYFDQELEVLVKPLSDVLDQCPPERIAFIKIDAQGVDLNVLESLGSYLDLTEAGMLEVPATERHSLYEGERHTLRSALIKLASLGFDPYAIKPNDHAANEYNIFFCRPGVDPTELEARLNLTGVHLYDGKHFWHNPANRWLDAPVRNDKNSFQQHSLDEAIIESTLTVDGSSVMDTEILRRLASRQRVFWGGTQPPISWFKYSTKIFDPAHDYRMPAAEHQQYDLVYLNERNLGEVKAWPMVVDEALRLLRPNGLLCLRLTNSPLLSIFELMHLIFARTGMTLHNESVDAHGVTEIVLRNEKQQPRSVDVDGITFGMITNGQRDTYVLELVKSVLDMSNPRGVLLEVLICGPQSTIDFLRQQGMNVSHVPEPEDFRSLGWITRKKNLLIAAATHSISVIAHDRYFFSKNFLEQIQNFGGDFDVMVCRQTMLDGRRFPDWVALGTDWSWSHPSMLEYGDWSRHLYVNGGLMIAKTDLLKRVPWNDLLFWNQAEDVELTRRLQANGIVPRLARNVEAITQTMRVGFMGGFQSTPAAFRRYLNSGPAHADAEYPIPLSGSVMFARMGHKFAEHRATCGVAVGPGWVVDWKMHTLEPNRWGEITLNTRTKGTFRRTLSIGLTRAAPDLKVLVNDIEPIVVGRSSKQLLIKLTPEMSASSKCCRIHILSPSKTVSVRHVSLAPNNLSAAIRWGGIARLKIGRLARSVKKRI